MKEEEQIDEVTYPSDFVKGSVLRRSMADLFVMINL